MEDLKEEVKQEKTRGERGIVGEATVAFTLKHMWAESGKRVSLKQFARQLSATGDQTAKDWFAHKKGSLNLPRSEKNLGRAMLEAQASKAARRKSSQGKSKAADTSATTTVGTKK